MPQYGFPGLVPGDQWCLCADRWVEAFDAGAAPQVVLEATHACVLEWATLDDLRATPPDAGRAPVACPRPGRRARTIVTAPYDLYDPDGYVAGPPHDVFTRLRAEQPVVWQDMPGEPGLLGRAAPRRRREGRHAEPVLFSAATGGVVLEDLPPESLAMMQDMLLAMDPPRHLSYRRNVSPEFTPKVMARLEPRIREICSTILDDAADRTLDFVHDVCAKLPVAGRG